MAEEFTNYKKTSLTPWTYAIISLVFCLLLGGFSFISKFNESDYQRDQKHWQEKLDLIASNRAEAVSNFIAENFLELRTLADNQSLKLYLTEISVNNSANSASQNGEIAQKSYLRNLLLFTASRGGFSAENKTQNIPANIPSDSKSGLAVLGNDNKLIVSTNMSDGAIADLTAQAANIKAGEEKLIDLQKDNNGNLYIGFSVPIYSIQGERGADAQIGKIVAIKTIDANLFGLLKQVGVTEKTLENLLLRTENNQYISPLLDGSAPLVKYQEETFPKEKLSDGFYNYIDYRGSQVLAVAREISGTNWQLISKIDAADAFAESGAHRASLVWVFTLALAFVTLMIIGLWWYSYSRHALMASTYFRELATKAKAHENLLMLVTNNQPESIYIVDENGTYFFANKTAEDSAKMAQGTMLGKTIADVQGAARAQAVGENCSEAVSSGKTNSIVQKAQINGRERVVNSSYIPLSEIPVPNMLEKTKGVLVVEQDISEVFFERERRVMTLKKLVSALVNLVDKRDPFAANHSLLVSQVAEKIAENMGLDSEIVETTKTAASLMNIGKILVPKALLTKTSPLNDEEKNTIRESMDSAFELLKDIPFDGKVAETMRQWQEKWDGSGKLSLKGEEILLSARIIAVANAFIGMVSPRSWRNSMKIDATNKFLLEQADSYFDRRVVIALVNYVENQSGRAWLGDVLGGDIAA
jgi:HD-GYP domain-containing protein (c-di-GMP phosphodiesterase class II)